MAGVQNDYNTADKKAPVTRIGNWVEQRALLESTGTTRGSIQAHQQQDTALRTVKHENPLRASELAPNSPLKTTTESTCCRTI
jgi:hypothetical protein